MHEFIEGTVTEGNRIGRKLGFPTANVAIDESCGIKNGVYAARAETPYGIFQAMVSIGTRPTVTSSMQRLMEVNLFDFEGDLYGKRIRVELVEYLRAEEKYPSIEELREQIEKDKQNSLKILNNDDKQ